MSKQLRKQLQQKQDRLLQITDELEAIGSTADAEGRELNDDDTASITALNQESKQLEGSITSLKAAIDTFNRAQSTRATEDALTSQANQSQQINAVNSLPARVSYQRSQFYNSTLDCYSVGQWIAGLLGNQRSRQWCQDRGMVFTNAMEGGTPSAGGYTVPDPMAATIIRLVEEYGVFRRFARAAPMTSDTLDVPKRTDGLTVYYPGEGNSITPSDITFGQVNLIARKYAQLAIMSSELNEDSIISMTDLVTQEMGWNFAFSEDTNSFLGDASAPFGGITGITKAVLAGSKHKLAATKVAWSDITKDDLEMVVAMLPQYSGINPRWFINSYGYFTAIIKVLTDLGGTDMRQYEAGGEMMLMGYPVTFTQVLPGANIAADDPALVFGDLNLTCYSGQRRDVRIQTLNELYAANDQIGLVGTMRADSVCHDVGTASEPGGVIVLEMGAAA